MLKLKFTGLILFFCVGSILAQGLHYKGYTWEEPGKLHELSDADQKVSQIVLKDKTAIEFAYGDDRSLYEYQLVHKIIKVNSNEAIERNNKVYIPLYGVENVLINKARVITSNGTVKVLDESNIKEAQDEENRYSYKYYAIEGIDIGSEIEYIYLTKSQSRSSGESIEFQSSVESRNVSFEIISPSALTYKTKSYNGFPDLEIDTSLLDEEKKYIKCSIDKIEAIDDEDFANYDANLMSVTYKLMRNDYRGAKELYTYSSFAELVYQTIQGSLDKKELAAVKKFVKTIEIPKSGTATQKIRAVEDYIKGSFNITNARLEGLDDLTVILDKKNANNRGITKLFCAVYDKLDIDYQLVMTSNRYKDKFDEDFETYLPLVELVLYFPSIKQYLAPTEVFSRLGLIPSSWTHNNGLFITPVKVGKYNSAIGTVKFIKELPSKKTGDVMNVNMKFNEFYDSEVLIERQLLGYYAQNYQPYYDFIDEVQEKKLNEAIMAYVTNDAEILDMKVKNNSLRDFGVKPLIISAKIDGEQFIEKAGPNYLFKIGDVIGPQAEMYQEKERKLPVENDYNRFYKRTIKFNIPDGYAAKNLDDLKMDINHKNDNDEITCAFTSEYTVDGSIVTVIVNEWYEQIEYPKTDFEAYRKVINAAADFNKIVIVLQKK